MKLILFGSVLSELIRLPAHVILENWNNIQDRNIIVRKIHPKYIRAYCMKRQALRTFKRENILAASKPRQKRGVRYALATIGSPAKNAAVYKQLRRN